MSYIEELRKKYPELKDRSEGDLLMMDYASNYDNYHIVDYLKIADPSGGAHVTISEELWDNYKELISEPLENETKEETEKRLYGNTDLAPPKDNYATGLSRSFVEGLTLGNQAELTAAGVAALAHIVNDDTRPFGQIYDSAKANADRRYKEFSDENPITSTLAETASMFIPATGLYKAGATASKAIPAISSFTRNAVKPALKPFLKSMTHKQLRNVNRVGRMATGATDAALFGAAVRYGKDQDVLDSTGIATDVAFGAAGQRISEMLPSMVQAFKNATGDAKQRAALKIRNLVNHYGIGEISGQLKKLGEDAVLADVLGRQGSRMARTAADLSPEAADKAGAFFGGRAENQNQRLIGDVAKATGADPMIKSEYLAPMIYDEGAEAVNQAYKKARDLGHTIKPTPKKTETITQTDPFLGPRPIDIKVPPAFNDLQEWEKILRTSPTAKKAFDNSVTSINNRAAAQEIIPEKVDMNMLTRLDSTKRSLQGMASEAARAGNNAKAAELTALAQKTNQAIDKVLEIYPEAKALRKNLYDREEALKFGEDLANGNKNFKDIINVGGDTVTVLDRMGKTNTVTERVLPKNDVMRGFGTKTIDTIGDRRNNASAYNKLVSDNSKTSYRNILGDNAKIIDDAIQREQIFNRTKNNALGGPNTAQRLLDARDTGTTAGIGALSIGADVADAATTGGLGYMFRNMASKASNAAKETMNRGSAPYEMDYLLNRNLPTALEATPSGTIPNIMTNTENVLKKRMIQNMLNRGMIYQQNSGAM